MDYGDREQGDTRGPVTFRYIDLLLIIGEIYVTYRKERKSAEKMFIL